MSDLRDHLRAELRQAMRDRDRDTVRVLRSVLGAIDNAESDGVAAPRAGAVEASAIGIGAAEAARRELTDADVRAVVEAELAERADSIGELERAGHGAAADPVRAELAVIRGALDRFTTGR